MNKLLIIAVILLQHVNGIFPEIYSSSHFIGMPVLLECGSLIKVNCSWQHNGRTIDIAERYRYVFSNGSVTADCSIDIGYFHEVDVGNWTCWSLSNDQFDGDLLASYSLTAKLIEKHADFLETESDNIYTRIGVFVTIPCKFTTYLPECHWLRNGKPVVIENRYKFVHFAVVMADCSINITSVQNVDFGTWQCVSSSNNARGYIIARTVQLTDSDEDSYLTGSPAGERNNTIVEQPQNSTAYISDSLILRCQFRDSARCVWLRNEKVIHIGNRHRYLIDNNNNSRNRTDCSLMISNIQTVDKGQWRCLDAGDDLHLGISSEEAFVSVINDDKVSAIIKRPTDVVVSFGNNVALTCLFDHPVNCDWSREGMSVMINGRYSYSSAENGVLTTDCSIQILAVNDMDVGDWSCANKLNIANSHFQNAHASLSLLETPSPVKILLNNRELTGFFVQLQDTPSLASMEVACVSEQGNPPSRLSWHMNEPTEIPANYEVEMVGNHRYTAKLRSNVTSLPRGRIVELSCIGDFPNITDVTSFMLFIGESEVKRLALVSSPVSMTLRFEKSHKIKLGCKFNKIVHCNWRLNGRQISFEKYTYEDGANGISSDCTIAINTTSDMMGRYQCYTHNFDNHQEISSSEALISFMSKPSLPWIVSSSYDHHLIDNSTIFVYSNLLPLHVYCESHRGNPTPILHWELDGKLIDNYSASTFTSSIKNDSERNLKGRQISAVIPRILLVKNATSLKCILEHPTYSGLIYDQVILLRNKKPFNPIMAVNATLVRNDVTVLTNTSTHIHCVSQAGYPAAKMHWELDGQTISGTSESLSVGNNLSTVILLWPVDFNWTTFSQSLVSLKCIAEHPEYNQPKVAKAVVKFLVANNPKVIHLMNTDTIMKDGSHFDFICQSSEAMSCGMKLNNVSVEGLPFSPSSIKGHTSKVVLARFKKDDVGFWQCTCLLSADNTTVDSKPIYLSLLTAPSEPEIRQGDTVITEIMLKTPDEIPDFKCVVEGANPAAYLLWRNKDNLEDSESNVIKWANHTYTTIIQWKNIIFKPQLNNMVYLYCLARHPAYDVLEKRAEVAVTFPLAPRNPRILFKEREVNNDPLIISTNDLQHLQCLCEQGNPVASLTWQVNYLPINSTFKEVIITLGIRTAILQWNPDNNQYLEAGPVLLTCTANHPKFPKYHQANLRLILHDPEAFSIIEKSVSRSNAAWVGIIISTFLLLLGIVAAFLYVRYHRRYSGDESGNLVSRIQGQLSALVGGLIHKSEEPFISFSNLDEETTISHVSSK